jgi:hypothetical protein
MANSNTYDHLTENGCVTTSAEMSQQQQYQQHVMNSYELNNAVAHSKPNFYNSNEIDQRNLINQAKAEAALANNAANNAINNGTNGNHHDVNVSYIYWTNGKSKQKIKILFLTNPGNPNKNPGNQNKKTIN